MASINRIIAFVLSILLIFKACNINSKPVSVLDTSDNGDLGFDIEPVRVVFDFDLKGIERTPGTKIVDDLNIILHDLGFKLFFEGMGSGSYEEYVRNNLNENIVFLPFQTFNYGLADTLQQEGLLGDFFLDGSRYAPGLVNDPIVKKYNKTGGMFRIPVGSGFQYPALRIIYLLYQA